MTNYAVIFPGQGSQNIEMLDSYTNVESFNSIINQASDILSYNIREVTKDESKLNDTTLSAEKKNEVRNSENAITNFCKSVIEPTEKEFIEHQKFLKKSLKKNYF